MAFGRKVLDYLIARPRLERGQERAAGPVEAEVPASTADAASAPISLILPQAIPDPAKVAREQAVARAAVLFSRPKRIEALLRGQVDNAFKSRRRMSQIALQITKKEFESPEPSAQQTGAS